MKLKIVLSLCSQYDTTKKPFKMNFKKYKQNLRLVIIEGIEYVQSYQTLVARVEGENLIQLGWWSVTTQKHINYAAKELNLNLIK